tara:strand:+ start:89 stop:1855 length:1767 start_codon:yes stop_codon:yes gene_type:complete
MTEQLELVTITDHPKHGSFDVEVPTNFSEDQVRDYMKDLDLDLLLGIPEDKKAEVGETDWGRIQEWENSSHAGLRNDKWYSHDVSANETSIAYGHKLNTDELNSGIININGKDVNWKKGLTKQQGNDLLIQDAEWAKQIALASLIKADLHTNPNAVSSLTSVIYNVGSGNWSNSEAKKALEAGHIEDFMHEAFDAEEGFVRVNDKVSRGLVRRRREEAQLFSEGFEDKPDSFSKMIQSVLEAINPISTAEAAVIKREPAPTPAPDTMSTLKRNSKDVESVGTLQDMLGMDVGEDRGIFGPATEKAVKAFQESQGLTADGVVGKNTWASLQGSKPQESSILSSLSPISEAKAALPPPDTPEEKQVLAHVEAESEGLFSAETRSSASKLLSRVIRKSTALTVLPDNLELFVTDILFKNILKVPIGGAVLNEWDLDYSLLSLVKQMAGEAIAAGRSSVTYPNYPKTKRGLNAESIIGGEGVAKADKVYDLSVSGFSKLAYDSYTDPVVTLATTLGGFSLVEEDGVWYAIDTYDAEKFIHGSASKGWYGKFRNVLSDFGTTEEQKNKNDKIQWKIRLGTKEELVSNIKSARN